MRCVEATKEKAKTDLNLVNFPFVIVTKFLDVHVVILLMHNLDQYLKSANSIQMFREKQFSLASIM